MAIRLNFHNYEINDARQKGILTPVAGKKVAIVNAGNEYFNGGGGVDGAVHKFIGNAVLYKQEAKKVNGGHDSIAIGSAVAFKIRANGKYPDNSNVNNEDVIISQACGYNFSTIDTDTDYNTADEKLQEGINLTIRAYTQAIEKAIQAGAEVINLPTISSSIFGFPYDNNLKYQTTNYCASEALKQINNKYKNVNVEVNLYANNATVNAVKNIVEGKQSITKPQITKESWSKIQQTEVVKLRNEVKTSQTHLAALQLKDVSKLPQEEQNKHSASIASAQSSIRSAEAKLAKIQAIITETPARKMDLGAMAVEKLKKIITIEELRTAMKPSTQLSNEVAKMKADIGGAIKDIHNQLKQSKQSVELLENAIKVVNVALNERVANDKKTLSVEEKQAITQYNNDHIKVLGLNPALIQNVYKKEVVGDQIISEVHNYDLAHKAGKAKDENLITATKSQQYKKGMIRVSFGYEDTPEVAKNVGGMIAKLKGQNIDAFQGEDGYKNCFYVDAKNYTKAIEILNISTKNVTMEKSAKEALNSSLEK